MRMCMQVQCQHCPATGLAPLSPRRARRAFRRLGWFVDPTLGDLCPDCYTRTKERLGYAL